MAYGISCARKNKSEDEKKMLELIKNGGDFVSEESLSLFLNGSDHKKGKQ